MFHRGVNSTRLHISKPSTVILAARVVGARGPDNTQSRPPYRAELLHQASEHLNNSIAMDAKQAAADEAAGTLLPSSSSTPGSGRTWSRPGDDLAALVKGWESRTEAVLPSNKPYVARLDGVSFKKYTQGMMKPFDTRMTQAMISTATDLVERFNAVAGFCCSDEITLVFPAPVNPSPGILKHQSNQTPLYSGRVLKLCSVMASRASAKFNHYMNRCSWDDVGQPTRQRIAEHEACFDCRVFPVDSMHDAMLCIYWRHKYDCLRNATMAYALQHFNQSDIHKLSAAALRTKLLQVGMDLFQDAPKEVVYGSFLKKQQFTIPAVNAKTGQQVTAMRTRVACASFDWDVVCSTDDSKMDLTAAKFWPDSLPSGIFSRFGNVAEDPRGREEGEARVLEIRRF